MHTGPVFFLFISILSYDEINRKNIFDERFSDGFQLFNV